MSDQKVSPVSCVWSRMVAWIKRLERDKTEPEIQPLCQRVITSVQIFPYYERTDISRKYDNKLRTYLARQYHSDDRINSTNVQQFVILSNTFLKIHVLVELAW